MNYSASTMGTCCTHRATYHFTVPFAVAYYSEIDDVLGINHPALYMAGDHGEYAVLDQRGRVIASNVDDRQRRA